MSEIIKSHCQMDVFGVRLPTHTEYSISVEANEELSMHESLANGLKRLQAEPLNRFVLGGCQHYEPFVAEYGTPASPLTWIQGDACSSGEMLSTQVTAIKGLPVHPILFEGRIVGTRYEDEYAKYIRLGGLLPSDCTASREEQTRSLFENMRDILQGQGMRFTNTIRTWLYLDNLLEWYDEFNAVRTRFFEEEGVFDAMVPASTGIGAANPQGAAIIADLFAVQPKTGEARFFSVGSPLQGSALDYRSSFSRAAELDLPTHRTLYISGTASIDPQGRSVNLNDSAKQIDLTMQVVEAILSSREMGWADVSRAIAYFKKSEDIALYKQYCLDHNIGRFPLSVSHADVRRDDLLFEIEVDAVKLKS